MKRNERENRWRPGQWREGELGIRWGPLGMNESDRRKAPESFQREEGRSSAHPKRHLEKNTPGFKTEKLPVVTKFVLLTNDKPS